jgi:hypothetical protein
VSKPLHPLADAAPGRYRGIAPLGIPCPEHASTTVAGRCYWHWKRAILAEESVPLEARQWCGFDLPETDPGWNGNRGWRSAEDELRSTPEDDEREAQVRGIRWVIDAGDERAELSV